MQISTMRIDELDKLHIKKIGEKKLPEFSPGDTLKVNVRIIEGKRQRIQAYEGVCCQPRARSKEGSQQFLGYGACICRRAELMYQLQA